MMATLLEKQPSAVIEAEIQRLIDELDRRHGDPDMEDDGTLEDEGHDEPSLGVGAYWTDAGLQYDLEADDCDSEDGGDHEPNGDEQDFNGDEADISAHILGGQGA